MTMSDFDDWMLGVCTTQCLIYLHQIAAGENWDFDKPNTMEIIVTKENADGVYGACKEIRGGYNAGINKWQMKKIKEARAIAHKFLYEEANDPNTSIERKIELVRLTSKTQNNNEP